MSYVWLLELSVLARERDKMMVYIKIYQAFLLIVQSMIIK